MVKDKAWFFASYRKVERDEDVIGPDGEFLRTVNIDNDQSFAKASWSITPSTLVKARFFNSYGPGEVPGQYRNVIPNFIYWAMLGQPLPITGTGEETRVFTFVGDIVDGLLRAGYFEAAAGQEFTWPRARKPGSSIWLP